MMKEQTGNKSGTVPGLNRSGELAMTDMTVSDTSLVEAALPALPAFDATRYAAHLDGLALSEGQARAFLETLWSIMVGFVDLGWGVDSVHRLLADRAELSSEFGAHALKNNDTQHTAEFNDAATDNEGIDGHHE